MTKEVNGLTAQEQLVTLQMHVTDPNAPPTEAGNSMTYVVTTDAWIAPDPPEVKEIQDFDKRFGQKLMAGVDMSALKAQMAQMHDMSQNPGMAQMFGGKPGSGEAMAADGERDGEAAGHAGYGGDDHGWERNWERGCAKFHSEFRACSGRSTCQFQQLGPEDLGICAGQLRTGGFPPEEDAAAGGCNNGYDTTRRWDADHDERDR